ncbi:MAG: hypothetical protein H7A46_11245 [Verrucomicrobiales bacterium]|nr:hypothetical protein [Verrucomicrobiales bacterium]
MNTKLILPIAAMAILGTGQAQLFLDHFDDAQLTSIPVPPNPGTGAAVNDTDITLTTPLTLPLGDSRNLQLDRTTVRTGFSSNGDSVAMSSGLLNLAGDANSDLKITITYDDSGNGMGLDVSGSQNLFLFGYSQDQDTTWSVTLWDDKAFSNSATVSHTQVGNVGGNLAFLLSSFVGIDTTHIEKVQIVIDPLNFGGDVNLHAVALVPEPQEYALALGFLGLGFVAVRRYRNK